MKDIILRRTYRAGALLTAGVLTLTVGCTPRGGGDPEPDPQPGVQQTPPEGSTSFVSADGYNGQRTQENNNESGFAGNNSADADAPTASAGAESERTAEEGDIYRVLTDSALILNLNAYRGFQILDFSNPSAPQIVGKVRMAGTPVEMYQVGERVFILLNNWRSYWRSRHDNTPETFEGGGVIVVDVSDVKNPRVTAEGRVQGWIRTSRLTRGGGKESLYVVANQYNGDNETFVKSFSVSQKGKLEEKTELKLGGYVQDIQATGERLLVSRYNYQDQDGRSALAIIDISSSDGLMVEGQSFKLAGQVHNKFNMNLDGDILRVVSGNSWQSNQNTNHVETFDASDIDNVRRIDSATFGDNEDLYATLFMDEKAFFVTYRRVDPFHAFEITADGKITEKSEFIVSGWNDYFKPVVAGSRLVGIGKNDEQGSTMAVSLYDVTDLTNPSPMITRAEVDLEWSWSEAQWDDRAFSVLEKATSVLAPDGQTLETGLVLLPFSGYAPDDRRYISAVQIFTFSRDTLTLRGVMEHGSQVRRSFVADATNKTTANLSEAELSLFHTADPDAPKELGRLELAPNFGDFKIYGTYGVRHHNRSDYYGWWGSTGQHERNDSLQVVRLSDDVDQATPVAEISIPARAQTYKVGDKLVVMTTSFLDEQNADGRPKMETDIQVWDMKDPTSPSLTGTTTTTELHAGYQNSYWGWDDCWDCGWGSYGSTEAYAIGEALVFPSSRNKSRLEGTVTHQVWYPEYDRHWQRCNGEDAMGNHIPRACTYTEGYYECSQLTRVDGTVENEVCEGQLQTCTQGAEGERMCSPVDKDDVPTQYDTHTYERLRYWQSYELQVVNLAAVDARVNLPLLTTITMPEDEEGAGLIADGSRLHVSYKIPTRVSGDSRPYVRYYYKTVDLSDAANPRVSKGVNIPGNLIDIDGATLITRDYLWGERILESSVNALRYHEGEAYLQGSHRFVDQQVQQIVLDDQKHALVSHTKSWIANYEDSSDDWEQHERAHVLTMLDAAQKGFPELSKVEIDEWAQLKDARKGRALYQVPGGLLVMDLSTPTKPQAQAYFPTQGWPRDILVDGASVYFSAGRYGLYHFDLSEDNLREE
ncbi:MAG: beta-propeller domain-containing protein [Myxococcota bacterium]